MTCFSGVTLLTVDVVHDAATLKALIAVGEPVLRSVPGYTLPADLTTAKLYITPPKGTTVTNVSATGTVVVGATTTYGDYTVVGVSGTTRGRSRLTVKFTDGTEAVAHYYILPPFNDHLASLGAMLIFPCGNVQLPPRH
jgi:hypothetical protein